LLVLTGCENVVLDAPILKAPFFNLDPLNVDGRDGGGKPIDYAALMRIGTAAQAGGDLATAVGVFRRAASTEPLLAPPSLAAASSCCRATGRCRSTSRCRGR